MDCYNKIVFGILIVNIVLRNQQYAFAKPETSGDDVTVHVTTDSTAFLPCFMNMSSSREHVHWLGESNRPMTMDTRVVAYHRELAVRNHYVGEYHLIMPYVRPTDAGEYRCIKAVSHVPLSKAVTKTVILVVEEPSGVDCTDRYGQTVPDGDFSVPYSYDPCFECECNKGSQQSCLTMKCATPPCTVIDYSAEVCCEYTCERESPRIEGESGMTNDESVLEMKCKMIRGFPDPTIAWYKDDQVLSDASGELLAVDLTDDTSEGIYKCVLNNGVEPSASETFVVGQLTAQQVGSRHALIHVKMPESYKDVLEETPRLAVHYESESKRFRGNVDVTDDMYALLADQPTNNVYNLHLLGFGRTSKPVFVRKTQVELMPRVGQGIRMSDALGDVIEVPSGIHAKTRKLSKDLVLYLNNVFAVEVSTYKGVQCPIQECGKFTIYSPGHVMDGVSLVFTDKRDFVWAKMHL